MCSVACSLQGPCSVCIAHIAVFNLQSAVVHLLLSHMSWSCRHFLTYVVIMLRASCILHLWQDTMPEAVSDSILGRQHGNS